MGHLLNDNVSYIELQYCISSGEIIHSLFSRESQISGEGGEGSDDGSSDSDDGNKRKNKLGLSGKDSQRAIRGCTAVSLRDSFTQHDYNATLDTIKRENAILFGNLRDEITKLREDNKRLQFKNSYLESCYGDWVGRMANAYSASDELIGTLGESLVGGSCSDLEDRGEEGLAGEEKDILPNVDQGSGVNCETGSGPDGPLDVWGKHMIQATELLEHIEGGMKRWGWVLKRIEGMISTNALINGPDSADEDQTDITDDLYRVTDPNILEPVESIMLLEERTKVENGGAHLKDGVPSLPEASICEEGLILETTKCQDVDNESCFIPYVSTFNDYYRTLIPSSFAFYGRKRNSPVSYVPFIVWPK